MSSPGSNYIFSDSRWLRTSTTIRSRIISSRRTPKSQVLTRLWSSVINFSMPLPSRWLLSWNFALSRKSCFDGRPSGSRRPKALRTSPLCLPIGLARGGGRPLCCPWSRLQRWPALAQALWQGHWWSGSVQTGTSNEVIHRGLSWWLPSLTVPGRPWVLVLLTPCVNHS